MKVKFKSIIKYIIILTATASLLWLSLNSIEVKEGESKFNFIMGVWHIANKPFLFLSAIIAVISHLIRAERWRLLLSPLNYNIQLSESFMSVMVGYFINLVIPRGGEVSRCYNLFRLNKTPINISFGTVIVERIVDVIFLLSLITFSFFIELDTLLAFFKSLNLSLSSKGLVPSIGKILIFVSVIAIMVIAVKILLAKKRSLFLKMIIKTREALRGIKEGVAAILKLEKRGLFIVYSLMIWICYFLMSYIVMKAFPDTENLSFLAALTIFVIGGIAMAVPLPGGVGSYHVLVPAGLVFLYAIPQDKAIAFTIIFHGWQTIVIIIIGASSLLISQIKAKHKIYEKNRN
ncbi:MAG: flippase-like domain-containing protein [Cyclobacteriaceae bacterium]|nr:flippase-like domain-containing protein [Cyclobacteriaceae bacterium]